jgi:hypothetical protein
MPQLIQRILEAKPGTASRQAGFFLWQLDDQSRHGWALYHIVEHEAGHYGQINLLRHQYRARAGDRG